MIRICRNIIEIEKRQELDRQLFEKTSLKFAQTLFRDARDILLGGRSILAVEDNAGETLFYLKHEKDYLSTAQGNKRLYETNYDGCDLIRDSVFIDVTLIRDIDIFIFQELEEYSWAIAEFVRWRYPEKKIIFLDKYAALFFGDEIEIMDSMESVPDKNGMKTMHVFSDGGFYGHKGMDSILNIYNSVNVINSLCWARKVVSYGDLNQDKTILLIDFVGGKNGMGDIVKIVNAYALLAWERGWEPVVYLTGDNQYVDEEKENMWEYYFEPLSRIGVEEALQSQNVISLRQNGMDMTHAIITPFVKRHIRQSYQKIYFKDEIVARYEKALPGQFEEEKILGVIMRGTDYLRDKKSTEKTLRMIEDCKIVMERNRYKYLFLASEDEEYWTAFHKVFGENLISISQKRIKYDYENARYMLISELLDVQKGKRRQWGEKYLFITYCLSKCDALLYNRGSGAQYMAEKWKETRGGAFKFIHCIGAESNQVVDELNRYVRFIKNHRVTIVWGTGYLCQSIFYIFEKFRDKIIFCDKKAERESYTFHDIEVISPQAVYDRYICDDIGILIMAADYAREIKSELLEKGTLPENIIKVSKIIAPETIF